MGTQRKVKPQDLSAAAQQPSSRRWLLFVHQLPPNPSNLRVQTWRRLQQFGSIPRKQSVYVLPDTPETREAFEWLVTEVKGAGGEAEVFVAAPVDTWTHDSLVEEFRRSRQDAYTTLAGEIDRAMQRIGKRRPRGGRAPSLNRLQDGFRQRLAAIERIDFFGSAGRDRAVQRLREFETRLTPRTSPRTSPGPSPEEASMANYQGRLWVTRPRPGVDRMSSAWLVRRFIDPKAQFGFAEDRHVVPDGAVPFDMFGVEFSHHGEHCTFETLCSVFGIRDAAINRIAAIVHDLDLRDDRFVPPEAPTVAAMIEGLQLAHGDDDRLLSEGMTLFESLYRSFAHSARLVGPRPLVRSRPRRTRKGRK